MSTDGNTSTQTVANDSRRASPEQQFLEQLAQAIKLKDTFDACKKKQDAVLQQVRGEIDSKRDAMRTAWQFSATEEKSTGINRMLGRTKTTKTKAIDEGGQIDSLESRTIRQDMKLVDKGGKVSSRNRSDESIELRTKQVLDDVLRLVEKLRKELPEPTEPGLTKDDVIRKEFIEPLVRENLLVDSFLPADLSVTQQFIEGTLHTYQAAVKEKKDAEERKEAKQLLKVMQFDVKAIAKDKLDSLAEKLEDPAARRTIDACVVTMKMAMAGAALNSAIMSPTSGQSAGQGGQNQQPAQANPIQAATKFGMAAQGGAQQAYQADKMSKEKEKQEEKSARLKLDDRAAAGVAAEMVNELAMQLTDILADADPPTALAVGVAYRSAVPSAQLAAMIVAQPPQTNEAIALLANGYAKSLKQCCPKDDRFAEKGKALAKAFKNAADNNLFIESIKEGEPEKVLEPLLKNDSWARSLLANAEFTNQLRQNKDQIADEVNKANELDAMEQLKQSQAENDKFRRELTFIDAGGQAMADEHTILDLIAKLQKRIAYIEAVKLGIALFTGTGGLIVGGVGAAVADAAVSQITDEILAPLKACGCLAKCIVGIVEAAECMRMYLSMKEQLEMALKAGSLVAPAIHNFVKNQGQQFTYETISASLEFAQFAGFVMKSTGIVTAAGVALQKSAAAASAATDAIYDEIGYQQMKAAWKVTRLALEDCKQMEKTLAELAKNSKDSDGASSRLNPRNLQNRQLALNAIKLNPTLAKYAIAYAAYEQKDPIAREVLNACGVTETMLEQRDAGVRTIERFLEVKFRHDKVLDGTQTELKDELIVEWQPKQIQLTARSWIAARTRAETQAKPSLKPQSTTDIEEALLDAEALAQNNDPVEQRKILTVLIERLRNYQPVVQGDDSKGKSSSGGQKAGHPHTEMQELTLRYVEEAEAALEKVP